MARLLACMDPNEAVLLLSALGDGTSKLVSNFLTPEDRDRLVEVRRAQECRAVGAQGWRGVARLTARAAKLQAPTGRGGRMLHVLADSSLAACLRAGAARS